MKKIVFITTLLTSILSLGQSTNYTQIDNSTTYKIPFLKVIGQNLSSANINSNVFKDIPIGGETTQNIPDNNIVIDSHVEDFQTKAISPQIGRNFKGNQMHGGTPPDNSMAISNNGFIVSFDNATIEYRNADGDSISWYVDLFTFIDSSTTSQLLFDPKVIYDNEEK